MTAPELVHLDESDEWQLIGPVGLMRMVLDGARKDAQLWCSAVGASAETKNAWARRAAGIKVLLDQLPPPANPRDPFDDIPGEPTPEEADARWRARAAADDAREAARQSASDRCKPAYPETFGSEPFRGYPGPDAKEDDEVAELLKL